MTFFPSPCYLPPPELRCEAVTFPGCDPEFVGIPFRAQIPLLLDCPKRKVTEGKAFLGTLSG